MVCVIVDEILLSSVSAIVTWSSANNSVDSYWFFESLIPVMSWFCHLVIILSKYVLNSVGERGQPWRTPLFISTGFDSLLLNFINILFCVPLSTTAFSSVSGICLDFKLLNKLSFNFCLESRKVKHAMSLKCVCNALSVQRLRQTVSALTYIRRVTLDMRPETHADSYGHVNCYVIVIGF